MKTKLILLWCCLINFTISHNLLAQSQATTGSNQVLATSIASTGSVVSAASPSMPLPTTSQMVPQTVQAVPVLELERQLNEYQKTLAQAAKDHQDFLRYQIEGHHKFLERCFITVSALITITIALIGFFGVKSLRDMRKLVQNKAQAEVVKAVTNLTTNAHTEVSNAVGFMKINADLEIAKAGNLAQEEIRKTKEIAEAEVVIFKKLLEKHKIEIQQQVSLLRQNFSGHIHSITKLTAALARACAILNDSEESERANQERRETIQLLKKVQEWAPTNRTIAVFIGRIFKQLGNYDAAIQSLSEVINLRCDHKEDRGESAQDHSALLYNKACYLNLKAIRQIENLDRKRIREDSLACLKQSIKLWPSNLEDAKEDSDFQGLEKEIRLLEQPTQFQI